MLKARDQERGTKAPLKVYTVGNPMERVTLDIMSGLPRSSSGNKQSLVIGDSLTRWVDAYPIRDMEATTVAKVLVEKFISQFGVPSFESTVFKHVCNLLGISKTRTSPYYPQSDGMIERMNRTLKNMLTSFVSKNQKDWGYTYSSSDDDLQKFCS